MNERTDYLESNMILMNVVESFVSPTLGSLIILLVENSAFNLWSEEHDLEAAKIDGEQNIETRFI